ncbi:LysR family transcriptional regulator [Paraburkholderia panacisoli]|uniref:LysR family transcriptional regulator n=1 Tax=Paraburkholderia panacisoli TaxID=2603818 RepID=A0A5B0G419_9BURK|nr:LysR substrate-binding domain-containing protein [Paraburkholderia panacisoli]KAA0998136.1 LysR family transcriptional regulator [Paraburkholderia panacisoli]
MELRHLKFFVAVATEGSFSKAAHLLHTSQPSLGRQIGDFELHVGVPLLVRDSRGCVLTPAGHAMLEQARIILSQVETAKQVARQAALSEKQSLTIGFISGYELEWFPKVIEMFRPELETVEIAVQSRMAPELTQALVSGEIDVALLRVDIRPSDLVFEPLFTEPLLAVMPVNHRLASSSVLDAKSFDDELMISMAKRTSPTLRRLSDNYLAHSSVTVRRGPEAENLTMAVGLVLSEQAVCLMPRYVERLLPPTMTFRHLREPAPTIEMFVGYSRLRSNPLLETFLSRVHAVGKAYEAEISKSPD